MPLAWLKFSFKFHRTAKTKADARATDPEEAIEADGHPVGQELLHGGLCAS